jgi:hypothetical protein
MFISNNYAVNQIIVNTYRVYFNSLAHENIPADDLATLSL